MQFQSAVTYLIVDHFYVADGCLYRKIGSFRSAATASSDALSLNLSRGITGTFFVLVISAIQGTLVMESSDPCRISFGKWVTLLILLSIQATLGDASQLMAVLPLSCRLREGMHWLAWLPSALLVIGCCELFNDVWFSLEVGTASPLYWVPVLFYIQHQE